jgi:hypothetical protein
VASGLMMEKVRSRAMVSLSSVGYGWVGKGLIEPALRLGKR